MGGFDQFNNIHDTAVSYFARSGITQPMYFAATRESLEDLATVEYLREIAHQAGINSQLIFLEDIGLDNSTGEFVDLENQTIKNLFKLMPWEDIAVCDFGKAAAANTLSNRTTFIEPAWKAILSNKSLMAVMWQMYPDHPLLLPTWFAENAPSLDSYVVKPFFSREGSNIEIWQNNQLIESTKTDLSLLKSQQIIQQKAQLFNQDNHNMILGSWVVDNLACGMIVRESSGLITGDKSTVVPHYIKD
jgi:glutathionylspermidine synthase